MLRFKPNLARTNKGQGGAFTASEAGSLCDLQYADVRFSIVRTCA